MNKDGPEDAFQKAPYLIPAQYKMLRLTQFRRVQLSRSRQLSVKIGDVSIIAPPISNPELVPNVIDQYMGLQGLQSKEIITHLRWLGQKYSLNQDMMLVGHPGPIRRNLALAFADICGLEVEYVAISRDTTESDLKQRKEIVGDTVIYHDQGPVRAAISGRLLILDGIENAERNVLPTLNNLLENREMALDDGRFLTGRSIEANSHLVKVHPSFRVIALGLPVPPYSGRTLDPPLRSRFQSRFVEDFSPETLLSLQCSNINNSTARNHLLAFYETLRIIRSTAVKEGLPASGIPLFSLDNYAHCINLLQKFPNEVTLASAVSRCVPGVSWMNSLMTPRFQSELSRSYDTLQSHSSVPSESAKPAESVMSKISSFFQSGSKVEQQVAQSSSTVSSLLPSQLAMTQQMSLDHACRKHICLFGPKGSGKSFITRSFAAEHNYRCRSFPLYQELTARDLLQRRCTDSNGNTNWLDSPLVAAARAGDLCVLDGVQRMDIQALATIRRLLQDGEIDLPNGERLSAHHHDLRSRIHPDFFVIALGTPPATSDEAREKWVTSDLGFVFHSISAVGNKSSIHEIMPVVNARLQQYIDSVKSVDQIKPAQQLLDIFDKTVKAFDKAAIDVPELKLSTRHVLRLLRAATESQDHAVMATQDFGHLLKNMMLIQYMPTIASDRFAVAMNEIGTQWTHSTSSHLTSKSVIENEVKNSLSIGDVEVTRRIPTNMEKVPQPLFHDNASQLQVLRDLLKAFSIKNNALLLIGNQGVGKNKLVDRLLELLRAEREYIQLHRDTSIQGLTLLPSLDQGRIVYEDSPMVKAARAGHVLVVDEADKADNSVVCVLKSLAEDGELVLYDGRRLLTHENLLREGGDVLKPPDDVILIHPDFKLIVLANRPGFPFLGNNFFRECGDVFSTHIVNNLDRRSELDLLRAYGNDVNESLLSKIAGAFADLRDAHANGSMSYPFSAREAVSVVRHLQAYPKDGVVAAIENILGFDGLSPTLRKQIAGVFQSQGLSVPLNRSDAVPTRPPVRLQSRHGLPSETVTSLQQSVAKDVACKQAMRDMKVTPWSAGRVNVSKYSIQSSRLIEFSEEVGKIKLAQSGDGSGCQVVDMLSTPDNNLHVLTIDPLELHTFFDVGCSVSTPKITSDDKIEPQQRSSAYVRVELVSKEMGYRLGSFQPLLSQMSGSDSALSNVAVLLPDLSMAIRVNYEKLLDVSDRSNITVSIDENEKAEAVEMLTMNVKTKLNDPGMGSGLFASRSKPGTQSSADLQAKLGPWMTSPALPHDNQATALWRRGGDNFYLVDLANSKMRQVDISSSLTSGSGIVDVAGVSMGKSGVPSQVNCRVLVSKLSIGSKDNPVPVEIVDLSIPAAAEATAGSVNIKRCSLSTLSTKSTQDLNCVFHEQSLGVEWRGNQLHDLSADHVTAEGTLALQNGKLSGSYYSALRNNLDSTKTVSLLVNSRGNESSELRSASPMYSEQKSLRSARVLRSSANNQQHWNMILLQGSNVHQSSQYLEAISAKDNTIVSIPLPSEDSSVMAMTNFASSSVVALARANGVISFFETDKDSLGESLKTWEAQYSSSEDGQQGISSPRLAARLAVDKSPTSKPRTGTSAPKHGKEDEKNEPHVGGNTWAGGSGGSDTAGLGGRGGPYRLDKGHTVHQISEADKAAVSAEARAQAAKAGQEALAKRLQEISMNKGEHQVYQQYKSKINSQIDQLRVLLDELSRRAKERVWMKHQSHGDLDDAKLVDGLTGERLVFKRRGTPDLGVRMDTNSSDNPGKKRLQFVVDVSGSMYRFNGQDRRLERMLEAVLLILEAMPTSNSSTLEYAITGHSGDSPDIPFLPFEDERPKNEMERLKILQEMAAHAQYSYSGDHTLQATELAIRNVMVGTEGDLKAERFVFVVSDANFERYGISPAKLARIMTRDNKVKVHFILIASLSDEAEQIARQLPVGHVHLCYESTDLPSVFKNILTSSGGAFDLGN